MDCAKNSLTKLRCLILSIAVAGCGGSSPSSIQFTSTTPASGESLVDVWSDGHGIVILAAEQSGGGGELLRSTDDGASFVSVWHDAQNGVNAVWGDGKGLVVGVGSGVVLRSTDQGQTFTQQPLNGGNWRSVWGDDQGTVYAVDGSPLYTHSAIARSLDGGQTWSVTNQNQPNVLYRVFGAGQHVYILGANVPMEMDPIFESTLLESTDRGETWTPISLHKMSGAFGCTPVGLSVTAPDNLRVTPACLDQAIQHSEDGGKTFDGEYMPGHYVSGNLSETDRGAVDVAGTTSGIAYAVGTTLAASAGQTAEPLLLRSLDDGHTWTRISLAVTGGLFRIWMDSSGTKVFALGENGNLIRGM